ncbi:right-handed parallel beta-helix repeat-containing protein [Cohnella soli]|uniref:Right-handed parallel beta-helix repeat-containing protein n=1 Tax=Cohnella soli TaxID=425005 RepID=A0ABW0I2G6_9BACL
MQAIKKLAKPIVAMLLLLILMISAGNQSFVYSESPSPSTQTAYVVELSKWSIYNDGTHAVETTQGINNSLAWAHKSGISSILLPAGNYLIDKDSRIEMVSNMTLELSPDATLTKETNGKERYELLRVGPDITNVTLKGGTYNGDKATHNYSNKDNKYSYGTHESGFGILLEGASDVKVEGIKAFNFTGDGLAIFGYGTIITDLYENAFLSGGIDAKGKKVKDTSRLRTAKPLYFKHEVFKNANTFEFSNRQNLPKAFEVAFYRADGTFISKTAANIQEPITIPAGADYCYAIFQQKSAKKAYLEMWHRTVSQRVTITDSEFAYNRRQGVTVGGADEVLLENNSFHHMKGTAPESGIDVEGGFEVNGFLNSRITIRNNEFYDNAAYDVILFDGKDAVVEGNHMASKGVIGLAVSPPFTGATIKSNHFDGTRIIAEHDAVFTDNRMNDAMTRFVGPNIRIDGMELTDSTFGVSAKVPFGVEVANVTITNATKKDTGLSIWDQPIRVTNMTIQGEPALRSISGNVKPGSIFDNLRVIGYNGNYGLSLPPGTYSRCLFEGSDGGKLGMVRADLSGSYTFDRCVFKPGKSAMGALIAENVGMALTITNTRFELSGDTQAVSVQAARSFDFRRNAVFAEYLTADNIEIIKINDYWKRNEEYDVKSVNITGNSIRTNRTAFGISTLYAGKGAPAYSVHYNTLTRAKLLLKENDKAIGNLIK